MEFVANEDIYERFVRAEIARARRFVWIGTADVKDMHIHEGRRIVPFLSVLSGLVQEGVDVRLLHAKEPGPRFRKHFDDFPALIGSDRFERLLCPRVHFKCIVIDGRMAYLGSANLTGAGLGPRKPSKRNFEMGIISHDSRLVQQIMEEFDRIFRGEGCRGCAHRPICPDPISEML